MKLSEAQAKAIVEQISFSENVHTAFRKGGMSKESGQIWNLIHKMGKDWGKCVEFMEYCAVLYLTDFEVPDDAPVLTHTQEG